MFLQTNVPSAIGRLLYSDEYRSYSSRINPVLNQWAAIPVIGRLAGISRIILSIIHILGHLGAMLVTLDTGHLKHVVKGGAELLRGVIEAIPIIGFLFANGYQPGGFFGHRWMASRPDDTEETTFFLVQIRNTIDMADWRN